MIMTLKITIRSLYLSNMTALQVIYVLVKIAIIYELVLLF